MLSVRLRGQNLLIKFETFMGGHQYKSLMNLFNNTPDCYYIDEKYTWVIPKEHVDSIINIMNGEDNIAWFNSIEEIKGKKQTVLPKFQVTSEGLDDMKLSPYPFQTVGISFLHDVKQGLCGDEMGLGKTVQALGAIHRLWKKGQVSRALIVCPTSLKYQWQEEIEKFTNHKGIVIDGSPKKREKQFKEFQNSTDYLFCIINYELVRNDLDKIKTIPIDAIAADEVHRIKNWRSKTSQAMKELEAPYKFGLTGTPMQNKPDELWNVFDWLNPKILGNYWAFRNRYIVIGEKFGKKNVEIGYKRLGELRSRVAPFMLRRMKVDVAPELPEMVFNKYRVSMTPEQSKLQDQLTEDFLDYLQEMNNQEVEVNPDDPNDEDEEAGKMMGFFNMMIAVSDSPELIRMSDSGMAKKYQALLNKTSSSPKLDELESIVKEQIESGNEKIVIFTQFTRMQRLTVDRLSRIGHCEIINGSMKPFERQAALMNFKQNDDINFLVCTDAANYGLNIQFANVLINIDIPWNPAIYDQRAGRVHRIGSKHDTVSIIDLITTGGIDERIEEALYSKRELAQQLVEKNDDERAVMNSLTNGLMKKLLEKKK